MVRRKKKFIFQLLISRLYRNIATFYGLKDQGLIPGRGKWLFSTLQRPNLLWGPYSLISNGHRVLFPPGLSGRDVKLTTHLQLGPRWRIRGFIRSLPLMSSWAGVQLIKYRWNFTFYIFPVYMIRELYTVKHWVPFCTGDLNNSPSQSRNWKGIFIL
jgi:hypothetical protein